MVILLKIGQVIYWIKSTPSLRGWLQQLCNYCWYFWQSQITAWFGLPERTHTDHYLKRDLNRKISVFRGYVMCLKCLPANSYRCCSYAIEQNRSDRAVIRPVIKECLILLAECIAVDTSTLYHGMWRKLEKLASDPTQLKEVKRVVGYLGADHSY